MSKQIESVSLGFKLDGKKLLCMVPAHASSHRQSRETRIHRRRSESPKNHRSEFNKWQASDFAVGSSKTWSQNSSCNLLNTNLPRRYGGASQQRSESELTSSKSTIYPQTLPLLIYIKCHPILLQRHPQQPLNSFTKESSIFWKI